MERDERLISIPSGTELQPTTQEYPSTYPGPYEDELGSNTRSIREYFNIVYKRLWIILTLTILTTAAVAFYMYRQPSLYSASTQLMIERPKKAKGVIDLGNDPTYYNTQLTLLNSPDLMYDVVVRLGLYRNPNLFKKDNQGFLNTLKSMFSGNKNNSGNNKNLQVINDPTQNITNTEEITLSKEEKVIAKRYASRLSGRLKANNVPKTSLVNITVTNENPVLAARVADGVAVTFMLQDLQREIGFDNKNLTQISKSIVDLKATINKQEQEQLAFMQRNDLKMPANGENSIDVEGGMLSNISSKWFEALDDLRRAEARYNTVKKSGNTAGLSGEDRGPVTNLRQQKLDQEGKLQVLLQDYDKQISEAEIKWQELRVRYTDEYKLVIQAKKRLDELKANRKNLEKSYRTSIDKTVDKERKSAYQEVLKGLRAQVQAARIRESQLRAAYNRQLNISNKKGVAGSKLTNLVREIENNRGLYDKLLQRQKEMELAIESSRPDNIKIVKKAGTQGGLIGPDRNRNIILAFLASLIGGIGLAFLLDYLDDSIRSSDDVSRSIGLPTLALIPHHNTEKKSKSLSVRAGGTPSALSLLADNRSPTAEAYRHLRTSLLFSSAGKAPKKILVTSSAPSEGKTTTAINTAITLAQSGATVVIIDCDLRRPRLHSHFNMENSFGLTNYLSGEKDTSKMIKDIKVTDESLMPKDIENLKVITSGPTPPNPAELLSSTQMKNLLKSLEGTFDHIIIDSPPAISFTDATILSTHVDGVVLVAMSGKSSIHLMKRFKQRLTSMGAKIYGVVLNGIKANSLDYSYYGYGYTYSYYENDDDDSTPELEDTDRTDLLEGEYDEDEMDEESIHETN